MAVIDRVTRSKRGQQPEALEENLIKCFKINTVSNIHLFNLFMPLIMKGEVKKVIAISSGHASLDAISNLRIEVASLYTISKAGLNAAVAKFSAQYAKDGVLFMSICPGMVDTGHFANGMFEFVLIFCWTRQSDLLLATEEQLKGLAGMLGAFARYAPNFKGPSPPETAVQDLVSVMERQVLRVAMAVPLCRTMATNSGW
jgi:Dehydrogenases with different specificities (related to short-chain alcohol dehydrogenases)